MTVQSIKLGVVVVREFGEFVDANLDPLCDTLLNLGCLEQNIIIKEVPSLMDVTLCGDFFARYTDVDGVIVVAPYQSLVGVPPIMYGVMQLQLQWSMVVSVGGVERANDFIDMVLLQNEMAGESRMLDEEPDQEFIS